MSKSVADSIATFKAENPELAKYLDDICSETTCQVFSNTNACPDLAGFNSQVDYAQRLNAEVTSVRDTVQSAIERGAKVLDNWEAEIDAWFEVFRDGLKQRFTVVRHAESSCASVSVCDPANFPVVRDQMRQTSERNNYSDISEYCDKAAKWILAKILPYDNGVAISSDDPDAISKLNAKALCLIDTRGEMLLANMIVESFFPTGIKSVNVTDEQEKLCVQALVDRIQCTKDDAAEMLQPNYMGKIVAFESHAVSNIGLQILNVQKRITELQEPIKQARSDLLCRTFDNGISVFVSDDKWLGISFGYKPDIETRSLLEKHGFQWSPERDGQPWTRKLTSSAIFSYSQFVQPQIENLSKHESQQSAECRTVDCCSE